MTGLLGAVGGLVGGVARFSGKLAGAVGGAVLSALADDGDEEGDRILWDALRSPDEWDEHAPNIYEQRVKVDQILFFFERDFERYEHYFKDPAELERLRVDYYNCINAIEFQNELLAQLVDEVLGLRNQLRSEELDQPPLGGPGSMAAIMAQGAVRKELSIKLAHVKLDIGERKSKRMFKDRERHALAGTLSPLLSDAKLQRLLEEQASDKREAEDLASFQSAANQRDAGRGRCANEAEVDVMASEMEAHATSGTMSRRRYKQYSDAELSALLREKDD